MGIGLPLRVFMFAALPSRNQPQNCRSQIQKGQELLWPPGLSGAVPQEELTTPLPSLPHWVPTQIGKFLLCLLKSVSLLSTSMVGTHPRWEWLLRQDLTGRSQTTQVTCRLFSWPKAQNYLLNPIITIEIFPIKTWPGARRVAQLVSSVGERWGAAG